MKKLGLSLLVISLIIFSNSSLAGKNFNIRLSQDDMTDENKGSMYSPRKVNSAAIPFISFGCTKDMIYLSVRNIKPSL